jgi:ubiquinone/menaquinone biosynthesis C-methylase UbiE
LNCIELSEALEVAKKNLKSFKNCVFHKASFHSISLMNNSQDFGYCLGILHYITDTFSGLINYAKKLKPGASFLFYLYYAFDSKPVWFKLLCFCAELMRKIISRLPVIIKNIIRDMIALFIYWTLAKIGKILSNLSSPVQNFYLIGYKDLNFYTMRTDSLDRFRIPLEKRFSKVEIRKMMTELGFEDIVFSETVLY